MAKFFKFKTILVLFALFFSANVRANVSDFSALLLENGGVCEAPPPDSFRVTSIGGTFVTLAWEPAWPGALHFIELKKLDGNGNWVADRIFDDVPGDQIFIDSLIPGQQYRAFIATKCPNGEVGTISNYIDFLGLILDLAIEGRSPHNPKPISCLNVQYNNYPWVGFRVSGGGYTGLFEVVINEVGENPYAIIHRVLRPGEAIFAVRPSDNFFPIIDFPVVENIPFTFKMRQVNSEGPVDIGYLTFDPISPTQKIFDLCIENDLQIPWKLDYTFQMLYATSVALGEQNMPNPGVDYKNTDFIVTNPCTTELVVKPSHEIRYDEVVTFRLWSTNGQPVFDVKLEYFDQRITFPMDGLSAGMYVLEIKTSKGSSMHKVFKL